MKNKFLLVGSLAFSLVTAKAQNKDSTRVKVNQTEIEFLYNHYIQKGDNSAVTGGEGTEELTVYGPALNVSRTFGKNTLHLTSGIDVISSASADNIDFVVSSASQLDARTYGNIQYERYFEESALSLNVGFGASIESDYYSSAKYFGITKSLDNEMTNISLQLQIFNDDLRWGRLSGRFKKPVKLIYPFELRNREWYDENKRDSYNANLSIEQIINKRNVLAVSFLLSYQKGLLSTPFHRVYFENDSIVVEQLPSERIKKSLKIQLNSFVSGRVIVRNSLFAYSDDFDIKGFAIENETAIKAGLKWTLTPKFRLYFQEGSRYFAPIREHRVDSEFYTSDYDLSDFTTYRIGFSLKSNYQSRKAKRVVSFGYNFYGRSSSLSAHILSLIVNLQYENGRKKQRLATVQPSRKLCHLLVYQVERCSLFLVSPNR